MEIKELEEKLKAPFKQNEIEWRITAKNKDNTKGLAVAYVTNRAIQNRLDEVLGMENWQNYFETDGNTKICGLSLKINGEWIIKYDGASDTAMEATKGGLSGAMKRAAVQWGIGRYLYNLQGQWVKIKHLGGKSYVIDEIPKLPAWALPQTKKKKPAPVTWESENREEELPFEVAKCISAFVGIGISRAELENYLHLEACMFTDTDIQTLRTIYSEIKSGRKQKDDYFISESDKIQNKDKLNDLLNGGD